MAPIDNTTYLTTVRAGRVCEAGTLAHYEAHLYVEAVSDAGCKVRHRQPVVGVRRYGHVTHRVDAVDVADWTSVTRFSPLQHEHVSAVVASFVARTKLLNVEPG